MNSENRQLTWLELLNVLSFLIGLENLEANLTQSDKQDLQHDLTVTAERLLNEIHAHLEKQDAKIDEIMAHLEGRT